MIEEFAILVKSIFTCKSSSVLREVSFLSIAKVLSVLASTDQGRKYFLQGRTSNNHNNDLLELFTSFVDKSLFETQERISQRIIEASLFFLRQFYKTYEGLLWMNRFNIHKSLAKSRLSLNNSGGNEQFDLMLIDNLLNFGATPKGVVLLHNSGSMVACVSYMLARYAFDAHIRYGKKMHVSQCEKFGYGTLVSQIATTQSGMNALCETKWTNSYLDDLFDLLECKNVMSTPRLDIEVEAYIKTLTNVLKVFTSFCGISACVKWGCHSFEDLFAKLILVDMSTPSELMNPDESLQTGLIILRHLTASIDSYILLESKFQFVKILKQKHADSFIQAVDDQRVFLIDENNLLCNSIIISTQVTGGPSERCVPSIEFDDIATENFQPYAYNWEDVPLVIAPRINILILPDINRFISFNF